MTEISTKIKMAKNVLHDVNFRTFKKIYKFILERETIYIFMFLESFKSNLRLKLQNLK